MLDVTLKPSVTVSLLSLATLLPIFLSLCLSNRLKQIVKHRSYFIKLKRISVKLCFFRILQWSRGFVYFLGTECIYSEIFIVGEADRQTEIFMHWFIPPGACNSSVSSLIQVSHMGHRSLNTWAVSCCFSPVVQLLNWKQNWCPYSMPASQSMTYPIGHNASSITWSFSRVVNYKWFLIVAPSLQFWLICHFVLVNYSFSVLLADILSCAIKILKWCKWLIGIYTDGFRKISCLI